MMKALKVLALFIPLSLMEVGPLMTDRGLELTVCPQGPPQCDFAKVQEAINAAPPGSTLRISPGLYTENLIINKDLKLVAQLARVQGAIPGRLPVVFIGADIPIEVKMIGLFIVGKGSRYGLLVRGQAVILLDGLQILNNEVGLMADTKAQVRLANSQVFANGRGMWLSDMARAQIQATHISGNLSGIEMEGSAILEIHDSLITSQLGDESGFGLVARASAQVSIIRTQLMGNRVGIMALDSASVNLRQSTIALNGLHGLLLGGRSSTIIWQSAITFNGTHPSCRDAPMICTGITMKAGSQLLVSDSHISDNTDWGVAMVLRKCGYPADDFSGRVEFVGSNMMVGNNWAGNHEGEACLP